MEPDGAVPVIADANSMTYVLHRRLGETLVITRGGRPITLRFVAALSDSIFQRELLMSQGNFLKLFPDEQGFPFLLVDTDKAPIATVRAELARRAADATDALAVDGTAKPSGAAEANVAAAWDSVVADLNSKLPGNARR